MAAARTATAHSSSMRTVTLTVARTWVVRVARRSTLTTSKPRLVRQTTCSTPGRYSPPSHPLLASSALSVQKRAGGSSFPFLSAGQCCLWGRVTGWLGWWKGVLVVARKVDCLLSSNLGVLMSCLAQMDGQRGSSTVGRRLGWEGRPAPVESIFLFSSITFLTILHLWSICFSGKNAYMVSYSIMSW